MTTQAEARTVDCPKCKAKVGQVCKYVQPVGVSLHVSVFRMSNTQRKAVERLGKPTLRPHVERLQAFETAARRAARAQRRKQAAIESIKVDLERYKVERSRALIAAAERQFDVQEWMAMRDWLRRYGSLFAEKSA